LKVNFGCGANKLDGWHNFDIEVDITNPLPGGDNAIDFILAEHVVEHVRYRQAVMFLTECYRVLKPGGVARIIVPSIERVMLYADDEYLKFVSKWIKFDGVRGAMGAIMWEHGHRTAWSGGLLEATMFYAGFNVKMTEPRMSVHEELQDVDGHWKVIGEHNNWIESSVVEGTKQGEMK
jgi:SAM-dependent methyltransferase